MKYVERMFLLIKLELHKYLQEKVIAIKMYRVCKEDAEKISKIVSKKYLELWKEYTYINFGEEVIDWEKAQKTRTLPKLKVFLNESKLNDKAFSEKIMELSNVIER